MSGDKIMNHTEYPKKCRRMTIESLLYTIEDCKKAIAANLENPNVGYYADEINYCSMELRKREQELKKILAPICSWD